MSVTNCHYPLVVAPTTHPVTRKHYIRYHISNTHGTTEAVQTSGTMQAVQ